MTHIIVNKATNAVECYGDDQCPFHATTQDRIAVPYNGGLYKPLYDAKTQTVVESATAQEIADILQVPPPVQNPLQEQLEVLRRQLNILTGVET